MLGKQLQKKYYELINDFGIEKNDNESINECIRKTVRKFMKMHRRVALYCYGYHTKMFMSDFISDIRDIVCIVDKNHLGDEGFKVIKENELEAYEIDGVIVSSFRYKEEIKTLMSRMHSDIDVLDIYDALEKNGMALNAEYYCTGPYQVYGKINQINKRIRKDDLKKINHLKELLKVYITIKDFRMAANVSRTIADITKNKSDILNYDRIIDLYNTQIKAISQSDKKNVVLLCMDGMRYFDYAEGRLEKTKNILSKKGRLFKKAYAYSTMTFESLIPAFSENTDQRTKYYLNDYVEAENCRFCKKAIEQNRKIYIYGDGNDYISGKDIIHSGNPQTLTEKLWDMTIDMCNTNSGLFYLHELYESHFSYPNPYTKDDIVANGTAMLFDLLPKNGGKLKTDYTKQLYDSLSYIDDTVSPIIDSLPCSLLVFADHGNMLLDKVSIYSDVKSLQLSAAEEWIRIPWVVVSDKMNPGEDDTLVTLLDINDVVVSLLDDKEVQIPQNRDYIKIGRSAIYNPDFKELYRILDVGYNGEAFEGFIFKDGYKLIVYSSGKKELYRTENNNMINDEALLDDRFNMVCDNITII